MGDHPLWSIGDAVTEDAEGRLRAIDAGEGPQSMQNATGVAFLTALSAVFKVTAVIDDAPNMMPALANADLPQAALHDMLRGAVYMSLMIASSTAATLLGLEVRKLISTLIGNASIRTSEGVFSATFSGDSHCHGSVPSCLCVPCARKASRYHSDSRSSAGRVGSEKRVSVRQSASWKATNCCGSA